MLVSNPAGLVTGSTGGMLEGPVRPANDTPAPSPQASSQGGSSNAPELSVLPLNPTPNPSGSASSIATPPLGTSSRPDLGDPASKSSDKATSQPASATSSPSQGHPRNTASAGGPRSNAFSNQALERYPPSSGAGAAATPTTVAASLRKALTDPSPSSTLNLTRGASPSSPTTVSVHSDASTFTTSFTTYDKTSPSSRAVSPRPPSPTLASGPSVAHLSTLFSKPSHSNPPSLRGRLPLLVTSPLADEPPSPSAPTPPPKSPRTLAFGNSSVTPRSAIPPAFMGSSHSKPAVSASNGPRSQPSSSGQRLQKPHPPQQPSQRTPSSATPSQLSPGGTTARVSRSPSPSPSPPVSTSIQSQSQHAPSALRSPPQSSASVPLMSSSGSTNSSSSKLKRAFAGRRKKSEDATTMFGKGGPGASTASLIQQQSRVGPELSVGDASTTAAQRHLAVQLPGPSATSSSPPPLKNAASRTFGAGLVSVPSPSAVTAPGPVDGGVIASPLDSASIDTSPDAGVSSGRDVNRASIIQLSPGIKSAVRYMQNIALAEEEGAARSHVGLDVGGDKSNKEKPDQEHDQKKAGDEGVNDGGKTDEGMVKLVQQEVGGQPPALSSPTMAAVSPSPGPSSPTSPSHPSTMPWSEKELESREQERGDQKEIWRKSDSTIGHHTIRNGGSSGTRTRPVSMAESFQSAYTIVPGGGSGPTGGNKRWSTVTGELDFQVMMEDPAEEEEDRSVANGAHASTNGSQSYRPDSAKAPSAKNINRRSMSLNVGISSSAKPAITPAYVSVTSTSHRTADMEAQPISFSASEGHPSAGHSKGSATIPGVSSPSSPSQSLSSSHSRTLSPQPSFVSSASGAHIASQSISGPLQQEHRYQRHQHTGSVPFNLPAGRVQPGWPSTSPNNGPFPSTSGLNPKLPPPSMSAQALQGSSSSSAPVSFRQTAISMSNGFAKRAAEKIGGIGKKWGLSTSSSGSGYSSTSSSSRDHGAPSSFSSSQSQLEQGVPLVRTHSNNSSLASSMKSAASLSGGITSNLIHHVHLPGRDKHKERVKEEKKKNRRTPNAPSGAYSVASSLASTSTTDSDGFSITGAVLGRLVRGPVMWNGTAVKGGMVFGKDLKAVVSQTRAIPVLSEEKWPQGRQEGERERLAKNLERRMLPALVVRCAQHILIWGIQEEGLFRVSGRASHIAKLRSEFDTGVDYDLAECAPGDLDPHAVASVFKAYLRELPEPILTTRLHRAFEAALTQELATYPSQPTSTKITTRPTPGLPSGPKAGFNTTIRKPPSLSTLAMPSFNGMPSASSTLIQHLKGLIGQLPAENRDLMRTVVELIRATARASKETKMPLSNLLLVFCPSLNMTPPLLKALCEVEGVWDDASDDILHIKPETVLDISMDRAHDGSDKDDDEYSDAMDFEGHSLLSVDHHCSGYSASAENSMLEEVPPGSGRTELPDRHPVRTLYPDGCSHYSSSSLASSQYGVERRDILSPPPSSSADSLLTPVSSGHASLSHLPLPELKKEPLIKKASARDLKSKISHPILTDTSLVQFPPSPPTPQKRRSIPILSLPSFSSSPHQNDADAPTSELRAKKPSLRRLFTKRSINSIGSGSSGSKHRISAFNPYDIESPHYTPHSASDSSVSTPLSAVTAPQSSISLPPVLDTPIEGGSSLSLAMGIDMTSTDADASPDVDTATTGGTFFASARSSQFSFALPTGSSNGADAGHNSPYRQRFDSCASAASSNHLGLLNVDDREEDWTQSVLIAAGAK